MKGSFKFLFNSMLDYIETATSEGNEMKDDIIKSIQTYTSGIQTHTSQWSEVS